MLRLGEDGARKGRDRPAGGAFPAFDSAGSARRWGPPLITSTALYAAVIATAVLVGGVAQRVVEQKPIDVTFVEKVLIEEPPPTPPPQPVPVAESKPQPAAAMAPVVRPNQKVRQLDRPPPRKELVAPKEAPQEAPKEADPSEDKGVAIFGEPGSGDPAGLEGGVARGGALGGEVGGIIDLPPGASPPVPLASNQRPVYPEAERRRGRAGTVRTVLVRLSILADGSVAGVDIVEGDEPFVGEAIKTVKRWRFKPARLNGQPISVYKTYRVKFALEA